MKRFFVYIFFINLLFACNNISSTKEINSAKQDSIQRYIEKAYNFDLPENEVIQNLDKEYRKMEQIYYTVDFLWKQNFAVSEYIDYKNA